jgi:hypothetical protein
MCALLDVDTKQREFLITLNALLRDAGGLPSLIVETNQGFHYLIVKERMSSALQKSLVDLAKAEPSKTCVLSCVR